MDMQTKNHSLTVICNQLVWNPMLTSFFESRWYFSPLGVSSPCWIKKPQKKLLSSCPSNKLTRWGRGVFYCIFHVDVPDFSCLWAHLKTVYHLQAPNAISDRFKWDFLQCVTTSADGLLGGRLATLSLARLISLRLRLKCLRGTPARVGVRCQFTVQRHTLINILEPKQRHETHRET